MPFNLLFIVIDTPSPIWKHFNAIEKYATITRSWLSMEAGSIIRYVLALCTFSNGTAVLNRKSSTSGSLTHLNEERSEIISVSSPADNRSLSGNTFFSRISSHSPYRIARSSSRWARGSGFHPLLLKRPRLTRHFESPNAQ